MKGNPNLDLLRAIAVSLVVAEHILLALRIQWIVTWNISWLGVVGVFLFFVHTSLVLMWSLERRPAIADFYIRRLFRIYPLAIAVVLVVVVFHIPTMHDINGDTYFYVPAIKNILSNLFLIQNLVWSGNILGVMWTLPLEVDMYFLLPFLFFLSKRELKVWPFLFLWIATATYDRATFPAESNTFAVCIPYFLSGVTSYVLFSREIRPRVPAFLMPILIAGLLWAFMRQPSWRHGWWLTLILGLALPLFRPLRSKWVAVASSQIAKYSYGIYLLHPLAIALGINYLNSYNLVVRLTVVFLSMTAVIPAYHFLEKPMIDLGARLASQITQPKERATVVAR